MKLVNLYIENFRHIKDTTIEFGSKITVISGQNGTGKSSVLGWVAQLCKFKGSEKQINGDKFEEDWGKIFKFCELNDYDKKYKVVFNNNLVSQKILSTRVIPVKIANKKDRYKCDYERNNKDKSKQKALDFPIIYLGLKRLIPLATENLLKKNKIEISSKEKDVYNKLSTQVLLLSNGLDINIDPVKTPNKNILAMKTANYGNIGNSAGQDNLSQIISALLSFERLKVQLGTSYKGGILLIDEIDATMYAGSQIQLIKKLLNYSRDLNIQIVFTTHSIEILEYLSNVNKDEVKINFLKDVDGVTKCQVNPSIKYIKLKISAIRGTEFKEKVICEDLKAESWIKNLIKDTDLENIIEPCGSELSDTTLITMSKSPNKVFNSLKYILDGDSKVRFTKEELENNCNIAFLPTNYSVESVMYHFVKKLSDEDNFWKEELNLTKQMCFLGFENGTNQNVAKNWFEKKENIRDYFGDNYNKLYDRWKVENKDLLNEFINGVNNIII
jgi:predicted ATP-binding protein involved in virulence